MGMKIIHEKPRIKKLTKSQKRIQKAKLYQKRQNKKKENEESQLHRFDTLKTQRSTSSKSTENEQTDDTPQKPLIYICPTLYRETRQEMETLVTSILRINRYHRENMITDKNGKKTTQFDFETHIWFDKGLNNSRECGIVDACEIFKMDVNFGNLNVETGNDVSKKQENLDKENYEENENDIQKPGNIKIEHRKFKGVKVKQPTQGNQTTSFQKSKKNVKKQANKLKNVNAW